MEESLCSPMISKRIIHAQKSHSDSLIPLSAPDTGKVRRHSEHVTAIVPLSFLTHTAALLGLSALGRVGSSCSNSRIFSNNCGGWYCPLKRMRRQARFLEQSPAHDSIHSVAPSVRSIILWICCLRARSSGSSGAVIRTLSKSRRLFLSASSIS
jgi:hypothetical protein